MTLVLFQDTYVELETANGYLTGDSNWDGATDSEKEQALKTATLALDDSNWISSSLTADQPLAWPREEFSYYDRSRGMNVSVPAGTMPTRLSVAVCNLACYYITYPTALQQYSPSFTSISVGPISLSSTETDTLIPPAIPLKITKSIKCFTYSSAASEGYWWRAN